MLSEEHLEILQQKLQHLFADINQLKQQLILFHAYYFDADPKQLPFPEVASQYSVPELMLPAIQLANQHRQRKQEFIHFLYESIKPRFPGSEKERRECFNYFSEKNKALSFLVDIFKLAEFEYVVIADPLYEELIVTFCLFLCNAVFMDFIAKNNQAEINAWIDNLLEPLYVKFQRHQEASRHKTDLSFADLELRGAYDISARSAVDYVTGASRQLDVETFEQAVLSIPLAEIDRAFRLKPLADRFTDETIEQYYHQWIPYILEETRAAIAQQIALVEKKKLPSFQVIIKSCTSNPSCSVIAYAGETSHLPELDHDFQKEAVLIKLKNRNAPAKVSGILAVASKKYFDKKTKKYQLEIHVLAKDFSPKKELLGVEWEVQWLAGLIGFHRMYEACQYPSNVPFMKQIIMAKLPSWPKQDQIAYLQAASVQANLNHSQFYAVSAFHQAEEGYYCLQGPPGTGKTTTVVNLLNVMSQDSASKILVCAPSNKAVRLIAVRTAKAFPELSIALTGVAKDLPEVLRPFFVNDHANMICDQMNRSLAEFQNAHASLIEKVERNSLLTPAEVSELCQHGDMVLKLIDHVILLCQQLWSPCKFKLKPDAKAAVALLHEEFLEGRDAINTHLRDYKLFSKECLDKSGHCKVESLSNLKVVGYTPKPSPQLKNALKIQEIQKKLCSAHKIVCDASASLMGHLFNTSESIEILLLQRAQIVFCTLVSSGRPWLKKHIAGVDILIVDEAAQSVEPETLIPLKFQPKKCLHVGDPRQLPATVISQAAQDRFYDNSMMLRTMEICGQTFQMLNTQYRMHPAICAWPSQRHYRDQLYSAEGLEARPSPLVNAPIDSLFKSPCVFFDVKGNEKRDVGYSKSTNNPKEAEALIATLCQLLPYLQDEQIGVITFYTAQVILLKDLLGKSKAPHKNNVTISTVDGFQGEEKDIVLLSMVRTCDDPGFLKDIRRVNVSVTRSRHHLYIFGNRSSLVDSNTDITRLIEHYEKKGSPDYRVENELERHKLK